MRKPEPKDEAWRVRGMLGREEEEQGERKVAGGTRGNVSFQGTARDAQLWNISP